mmetsp:Transcript_76608/g.199537  ORF Transcript_76608/g.199537 Transcript_76608/m.199537 type:complete len:84 (+) Transcript_76608:83-334(+)
MGKHGTAQPSLVLGVMMPRLGPPRCAPALKEDYFCNRQRARGTMCRKKAADAATCFVLTAASAAMSAAAAHSAFPLDCDWDCF